MSVVVGFDVFVILVYFGQYDIIFVPIHINKNHWTLAKFSNGLQTLTYYDSFGHSNDEAMSLLKDYFEWVLREREKLSNYRVRILPTPEMTIQKNGYDCGIFICRYAERLSRMRGIVFDPATMLEYRRAIEKDIRAEQISCTASPHFP